MGKIKSYETVGDLLAWGYGIFLNITTENSILEPHILSKLNWLNFASWL